MISRRLIPLSMAFATPAVLAHHGVAGVGAASLEGPGAPIESATSATLPKAGVFGYLKLDHAKFKRFDADPANPESDYANYWIAGLGYGLTPYLSAYVFQPYHAKVDEPGGFTTRGFADPSLFLQLGFKYDRGFQLVPENETADDLEDWHFTVFGGRSSPTANPNLRDTAGNIDPGKSTGFGKPSYTIGMSATKVFAPRWTFNSELSHLRFRPYRYADGNVAQFGGEYRANGALNYRAYSDMSRKLRIDLIGEAQFLRLERDQTNGIGDQATGGSVGYAVAGVRVYWDKVTAALGIKKAVWTKLNESAQQQGGEGKERYRVIFTFSRLF